MNLGLALLSVFACSVAGIALALHSGLAHRIAVDTPNARSLHDSPTPRSGGILFLPWAAVATAVSGDASLAIGLAMMLAAVSLLDDRIGLPIGWRFAMHLACAVAVVFDGDIAWAVALGLAVAWMTNLYNFMDGADGLAGGMTVIGFGAYGLAALVAGQAELASTTLFLAAGAAAFLVFNFPPAKIFLGDAGSIPLGFLAGALGVEGWRLAAWPWWFPLLVFSPFIVDASQTLLRRMVRGERFWQPHREHAYQKLVRMGWSHGRLARAEYALMAMCAASAVLLLSAGAAAQWSGLLAWSIAYAAIGIWIERFWSRAS